MSRKKPPADPTVEKYDEPKSSEPRLVTALVSGVKAKGFTFAKGAKFELEHPLAQKLEEAGQVKILSPKKPLTE